MIKALFSPLSYIDAGVHNAINGSIQKCFMTHPNTLGQYHIDPLSLNLTNDAINGLTFSSPVNTCMTLIELLVLPIIDITLGNLYKYCIKNPYLYYQKNILSISNERRSNNITKIIKPMIYGCLILGIIGFNNKEATPSLPGHEDKTSDKIIPDPKQPSNTKETPNKPKAQFQETSSLLTKTVTVIANTTATPSNMDWTPMTNISKSALTFFIQEHYYFTFFSSATIVLLLKYKKHLPSVEKTKQTYNTFTSNTRKFFGAIRSFFSFKSLEILSTNHPTVLFFGSIATGFFSRFITAIDGPSNTLSQTYKYIPFATTPIPFISSIINDYNAEKTEKGDTITFWQNTAGRVRSLFTVKSFFRITCAVLFYGLAYIDTNENVLIKKGILALSLSASLLCIQESGLKDSSKKTATIASSIITLIDFIPVYKITKNSLSPFVSTFTAILYPSIISLGSYYLESLGSYFQTKKEEETTVSTQPENTGAATDESTGVQPNADAASTSSAAPQQHSLHLDAATDENTVVQSESTSAASTSAAPQQNNRNTTENDNVQPEDASAAST
jgi:hypothetical protein